MRVRIIAQICLCALAAACSQRQAPVQASPEPEPVAPQHITFGLSMPLGAEASPNAAALVGDYLTKELQRPVDVRVFTYGDLVDALAMGEVDIASLTPLTYVKAAKLVDVTIVRKAVYHGATSYESVLFVRKDSPVRKLQDLEHKKVAWVQKGSASGNLVPRALLRQREMDPNTFFAEERFLPDHGQVCQAVADGVVDVGASFADVLPANGHVEDGFVEGCRPTLGDERVKDMRIIARGDALPNDVVIARNGLSPDVISHLGAALDALPGSADGLRVLRTVFHADSFTSGSEADFTALRTLTLRFPEDG